MTAMLAGPFGSERIDEIPLDRAPLVKVVAQIQFPRLSALLSGSDAVNTYAAQMRSEYPILDEMNNIIVTITPEGVHQQPGPSKVWVLQSADGVRKIGVSDTSLSIETSQYTNRTEFCAHLAEALQPFIALVEMPYVARLGVRYINRLENAEDVAAVPELLGSPVNGVLSTPLPPDVKVDQSLSQSIYRVGPHDGLLARWGLLPPNAVVDPTLTPTPTKSFLLDLDAYREYPDKSQPVTADIVTAAEVLGARAYRYFRWAVTPRFLERFGGEL